MSKFKEHHYENVYKNAVSPYFRYKTKGAYTDKEKQAPTFQYMTGILQNKKYYLYQINGVDNHIHILIDLHSTIAVSGLIKDIKLASSKFIKEEKLFPRFNGWQTGYTAFTYSLDSKDRLINYIKRQESHHRRKTFEDELKEILAEFELEYLG